jgi:hypothetical protein
VYVAPTVADFKAKFTRDFPYGITPDVVNDSDIQRAINESSLLINEALCGSQEFYTLAYLFLAAHRMVMNLRASSVGLAGNFDWLIGSKGVGSVSVSTSIPQRLLENPVWSYYCKSTYGVEYLMLMLPRLSGAFGTVAGWTQP